MKNMSWHEYFMKMATLVASKSKDRSTKVGAVLVGEGNAVLGVGYNGMVRNINDNLDIRHERPQKYSWFEHSERNCIYNAARHGVKVGGAKLYISGHGTPCADCARAIIQSGIVEIITLYGKFDGKGALWEENMKISLEMLKEAGVKITWLDDDFNEIAV